MRPETIAVVGLGRFGTALSAELAELGHEVLGIDTDERLVQTAAGRFTHVIQADATDIEAMRQAGVADLHHAVVAIGDAIQASILSTATLADLGVPDIWAKAQNDQHSRILTRVGADHVVFPERDTGRNVAHRVTSQMLDYIQIDEGFALVETNVPERLAGMTLVESDLRRNFGVNVVGVKPDDGSFAHASPTTTLRAGDVLLVAGDVRDVERFAAES